jgi:hypothetical protein
LCLIGERPLEGCSKLLNKLNSLAAANGRSSPGFSFSRRHISVCGVPRFHVISSLQFRLSQSRVATWPTSLPINPSPNHSSNCTKLGGIGRLMGWPRWVFGLADLVAPVGPVRKSFMRQVRNPFQHQATGRFRSQQPTIQSQAVPLHSRVAFGLRTPLCARRPPQSGNVQACKGFCSGD